MTTRKPAAVRRVERAVDRYVEDGGNPVLGRALMLAMPPNAVRDAAVARFARYIPVEPAPQPAPPNGRAGP